MAEFRPCWHCWTRFVARRRDVVFCCPECGCAWRARRREERRLREMANGVDQTVRA